MKKFLKMMLALSVLALAISGCNIFGNDDDDDGPDLNAIKFTEKGSYLLEDNDASSISNISNKDIISISKATYGDKNLGCYLQAYNSGDEDLKNLTFNFFLRKKGGSKVATYLEGDGAGSISSKGYLPNESQVSVFSSENSANSKISGLDNGDYELVFEVVGGTTATFDITIKD